MSVRDFVNKRKNLLHFVRSFFWWSSAFGIDPPKFVLAVRGFPIVLKEYFVLKRQNERMGLNWHLKFSVPCLSDRYDPSGTTSGHYFYQDLLVAQKVFARQPDKHVDVGSRVDGFVAHVSAFRPIEVFDIRPQDANNQNMLFRQCDVMNLPTRYVDYCDSLSCLHALEHFGLGRYGEQIDINGHLKGFESLHKMLRPGGILYLSLPIGKECIEFNGHRIFAIKTVIGWTKERFELSSFSYVDDTGNLYENAVLDDRAISENFGLRYGCGIFELIKSQGRPTSA